MLGMAEGSLRALCCVPDGGRGGVGPCTVLSSYSCPAGFAEKLSDAAGARSQATTRQDQATETPGSPAPLTGSTGQKVPTAK